MDLEPGSDAYRIAGACLRATATLYPLLTRDLADDIYDEAACIATSRTLIEVLRHFGIPARPMPVDVHVTNLAWERDDYAGIPPDDRPEPAWSLAVGKGLTGNPAGWDGHLLVRIAQRWMLEANGRQFHRPGRIHMPRSWMEPWPTGWTARTDDLVHELGMSSPESPDPTDPRFAMLRIRQRPDNLAYRRTPAWTEPPHAAEPLIGVIEQLRDGTLPTELPLVSTDGQPIAVIDTSVLIDRWNHDTPGNTA